MAKIKGPLFSIKGVGKVGKSIIYQEAKGIKKAKIYKVPDNPNTTDQQDQRGFMTSSVLAWKTDGYNALDIDAWNLYAKIQKGSLSGYNMFLRERINKRKIGHIWPPLWNCVIETPGHAGCVVYMNCDVNRLGRLYLGKSKYSMLQETEGIFDGTKYKFAIAGLDQNTKYYFYIKNVEAVPSVRTGIYSFKTITYTAPPLDVGNEAIDRVDQVGGELTLIDTYNPANANGTITEVEVYLWNLTSIKIAIFYQVEGSFFSTRSWVDLGYVPEGYSKHAVNLPIQEGDFIGIYTGAGEIKWDYTGLLIYYNVGDLIPCTNVEFPYSASNAMSLKGTGIL